VIRGLLVQSNPQKPSQRQRIGQPPSDPTLAIDALEISDQQRPKVNPRSQRWPSPRGPVFRFWSHAVTWTLFQPSVAAVLLPRFTTIGQSSIDGCIP
jgi:hypothetical protein